MCTTVLTHLWIKAHVHRQMHSDTHVSQKNTHKHIYSKVSQGKNEWHIFQVVLWLKLNALGLWYSWVCTQWEHVDKIKSGEWQEWKNSTWTCYLSGGDGCFANITRMILQEFQLLVSDGFVFSIMHEKLTAAELEYCTSSFTKHIQSSRHKPRSKKERKKRGKNLEATR